MKTLLQINSVANWGSTGRIAEGIGQLAAADGWNSYIAFGRHEGPSLSKLVRIGTQWDIRVHGIYTRLLDMHGFASTDATKELVKKIKIISPDVIHLHNLHGYYLNIQVLFDYLRHAAIPVVWTFHDCWPLTGHCVYFDFCGCQKWKTGCFACPQKATYPASVFIDRSERNYRVKKNLFSKIDNMVLVSVSNWMADILKESFLHKNDIRVISNGIDTEAFYPQQDGDAIRQKYLTGDRFLILGVASPWSDRKGLSDFVRLSERLTDDFRILLVGLSEKQIKSLPQNITGISRTADVNELRAIYSAADLYINPTWEDNFPTTNLESLACGTPVVTYNTGGSIEAVSASTGYIVDKGDVGGLLNIVHKVRENGSNGFLKACRQRAVDFYRKEICFSRYIELYNELVR